MILLLLFLFSAPIYSADVNLRGFPAKETRREKEWEEKARAIPRPERIEEFIRTISKRPHHAGSPESKAVAEYLLGLLKGWGLDASIEEFEALLPTPTVRKLELIAPVRFEAKLQEPRIPQDPNSSDEGQLPSYNAYSMGGDISAPLVYVNYGVPDDYAYLKQNGVDVKGKIVIARYGGSWRGVKPKVAYENGALACLIYSDPRDDGYFAGDVYPGGPFRPKDGVQRGSVMDMAIHPGDPLSPGWASEKGSRRLEINEATTLQKIPVLPISYADALPLLNSLAGPVAPDSWRGALPVTYHIGPGPAIAHLQLYFDWSTRPIYNVIARIRGSEFPDQWVMYGNHHDAWVNGAADPASGAAALLETARSLSELRKQGWQPKRTILLGLWDAEEFGLIGSTEWAEKHGAELDRKLVAYLNSDMNGTGPLHIGGSHTLEEFMAEVLRDVGSPESGKSLLEEAMHPKGKPANNKFAIAALGSGSDYTVFVHHLGVSSLNLGFSDDESRGIYHSIYDSFYWYSHFSDTKYTHGVALSQVMSTSLLRLADAPLLPFQFVNFGNTVADYVADLSKIKGAAELHLDGVRKELASLEKAASGYEARYKKAVERSASTEQLATANEMLFRTERTMLAAGGLPGRDWFKHQFYAPGLYTGYDAKTLPGIREAAEAGRWDEANRQAEIAAATLRAIHSQIERAEKALGF